MNEEKFKKGISELKNIRMTEAEKKAVLEKVFSSPVKSPYLKRIRAFAFVTTHHRRVILVGCLVVILSFGGAIDASNESLPGDILYPIKTAMVEPILDRVYSTPEKKLVWEEEKVERRIVEAERLIEKDELSEENLLRLEAKIELSSIAFAEAADLVASSTATSSSSKKLREKKIKHDFRAKINERKIAFDDFDEDAESDAAGTLMMSAEVSDQDRVLNELSRGSSISRGKNINREKIERLKRAATKNLNGDLDDEDDKDSDIDEEDRDNDDDEDLDDDD